MFSLHPQHLIYCLLTNLKIHAHSHTHSHTHYHIDTHIHSLSHFYIDALKHTFTLTHTLSLYLPSTHFLTDIHTHSHTLIHHQLVLSIKHTVNLDWWKAFDKTSLPKIFLQFFSLLFNAELAATKKILNILKRKKKFYFNPTLYLKFFEELQHIFHLKMRNLRLKS